MGEIAGASETVFLDAIESANEPIVEAIEGTHTGIIGAFNQVKLNLDSALANVKTGVIDIAEFQAEKEANAWKDIQYNFKSTQDLAYEQFLNTFDQMTLGVTGIANGIVKGIGDALKPSDTGKFPLIDYFVGSLMKTDLVSDNFIESMFDTMTKVSAKFSQANMEKVFKDIEGKISK